MCAGCCGYIPDTYISKVPFIGHWLVQKSNFEKGGLVYKIFKFFCRNKIKRCVKDFEEEFING